jgi:hypothetical protein
MGGNMEKDTKSYLFNGGIAIAVGLILSALVNGWFFSSIASNDSITVTGSAKRRIKSDLVVWKAGVSYQAPTVADAYRAVSSDIPKIKAYLVSKGIPETEMTISAITTSTIRNTNQYGGEAGEITGYALSQEILVRSKDVDKIAVIARESAELINQGIVIQSSNPQFYYTALGDLKVEMLGEAAKDAKNRAEQIAASTDNSVGAVKSAKMGVLQITPPDSTEVSDYGTYDTGTIDKDITAVVNITFGIR